MINTVAMSGTVVMIGDGNTHIIGVIECNEEQFYILFDKLALPEPKKIKNRYVSINGVLQHFKHQKEENDAYTIELGIFVRRLEVYDL